MNKEMHRSVKVSAMKGSKMERGIPVVGRGGEEHAFLR